MPEASRLPGAARRTRYRAQTAVVIAAPGDARRAERQADGDEDGGGELHWGEDAPGGAG